MKKNKLFVVGISSLIVLSVIGLSDVGFAEFVPGGGGGGGSPPPPSCDKYGVFLYATDAGHNSGNVANADKIRTHIANYKSILLAKGYSAVFDYEDVGSHVELYQIFAALNAVEDEYDAIFFYVWGHGWWDGYHSGVKLNPYTDYRRFDMNSYNFNNHLNGLDTTKIAFLVESCKSGGFVLEFQDDPYLAMTSADTEHNSFINIVAGEALFSNTFWYTAEFLTDNAWDCWNWAATWNIIPAPQFYDGLTTYTFF